MKSFVFSFFLLVVSCTHAPTPTPAPTLPPKSGSFLYPEYENDFRIFVETALQYSVKYQNDPKAFARLTLPFAPLTLSSKGKASQSEFRNYQNFSFGYISKIFDADPAQRSKDFFCSPSCWQDRADSISNSIAQIKSLANDFLKLKENKIISHWNMDNRFRVDNWFFGENKWGLAVPSKDLGLISSGLWENPKQDKKFFEGLRVRVTPLIEKLKKVGLIAMIKFADDSVLAIADGFADNAWGVMLLSPETAKNFNPPEPNQWVQVNENTWLFRKGGLEMIEL